jgi:hypothetical protein
MVTRAVEAGVPAGWVAGDEVYGADPRLRATIRGHGLGYGPAGRREPAGTHRCGPMRVDQFPALLPSWVWQRRSAGAGSKGADARAFGERLFSYYNHEHRHFGIGLHTLASVHYGTATEVRAQRQGDLERGLRCSS